MKLHKFFILLTLIALPSCSTLGQAQQNSGPAFVQTAPEVVDDRQLVVLATPPGNALIALAEGLGYELLKVDALPALDDVMITLRIPDGRDIPQAIAEIEAAAPTVTAGANHLYRLQAEPANSLNYAARLIGWPASGCRARQRVGMVDAGLPAGDPKLRSGAVVQRTFVGNSRPTSTHGTLMAELLVGQGRVTGTPLFSAVAVDPGRDNGETAGVVGILQAVNWLAEQQVDVINISLAGPRNKLLNRGLGRAAKDGMVMVAAAGNAGPNAPPQYPAAFPFVIAVTAVDQGGAVYTKAVRGKHIDLAAPGVDILIEGRSGARVLSGTSAAAPFVTAAIVTDPRLVGRSVDVVRTALGRGTQDLGATGRDPVFGAGLVSAPAACDAQP